MKITRFYIQKTDNEVLDWIYEWKFIQNYRCYLKKDSYYYVLFVYPKDALVFKLRWADSNYVSMKKPSNGEFDAAFFYCPYIPLTSSGVLIDPNSLKPVVNFMTRYGKI